MKTFTIDTDNNITVHSAVPPAQDNMVAFATEKELASASAAWPNTLFVEVWNSFAGVAPFGDLKPIKKFTDRKSAVSRIWKAIQVLEAPAAPVAAPVEAKAPKATKGKAKKVKATKAATKPTKATPGATKKEIVLGLLARKNGVTLNDLMSATGWQAHSVRGFIATMGKTHSIASVRTEAGDRQYSLQASK